MRKPQKLSNTHVHFIREYEGALFEQDPKSHFSKLIQHHAAHLIKLALERHDNHIRSAMNTWVAIDKIDSAWINKICPVIAPDTQKLHGVASDLVKSFSHVLGDYIVEKEINNDSFDKLVKSEAEFYKLVPNSKELGLKWVQYTNDIIAMSNTIDIDGKGDDFYHAAHRALVSASLLGMELYVSIDPGGSFISNSYYAFTEKPIKFV